MPKILFISSLLFLFLSVGQVGAQEKASLSASSTVETALKKGVILSSDGKQCHPFSSKNEQGETEGDWSDYYVGSMSELKTPYGSCFVRENNANDLKGCCLNLGFEFQENDRLFGQGDRYLIKRDDPKKAYSCNYFRLGLAVDEKNKKCQVTYKQIDPTENTDKYKDEQKMFDCFYRPDKEAFWCSEQAYDFSACNYRLDKKQWQDFYLPEDKLGESKRLITPYGDCDFSSENGEDCCRQILSFDWNSLKARKKFNYKNFSLASVGGVLVIGLVWLALKKNKNKKK